MKINIQSSSIKNVRDHTVIVPLYQQGSGFALSKSISYLKPLLERLKKDKSLEPKFKQSSYLRYIKGGKSENIFFICVGQKEKLTLARLREALIFASSQLSLLKVPSFSFPLCEVIPSPSVTQEALAQAVTESLVMPLYRFTRYKKDSSLNSGVKALTLLAEKDKNLSAFKSGVEKAKKLIDACNLVRDLVNTPSNELRTDFYAELAQDVGKKVGLKVKIFKENDLKKEGFNTLLAVNKGSDQPPRFVILEHNGEKKDVETICLVGKGITFDSGGISLKPSNAMEDMKMDMAGSATVLAIMKLVSEFKLPLKVIGLMAITDNMPSGKASVPGDIVKSYSGKTIEILNTDAEGRLILADALAYADKTYEPNLIIDFATLTGACIIALGEAGAGVMGTDQVSIDRLLKLSESSADKIWQLPLWEEYREELQSDYADIKNIGNTKGAGASKGALFLRDFVRKTIPWVHFDIAGSAFVAKPTHRYYPKGATGTCVRLVTEFLLNWK